MKTAEEFIKENRKNDFYGEISNTSELMIELAKMHVTEAITPYDSDGDAILDKQSILNAYPLDQIK